MEIRATLYDYGRLSIYSIGNMELVAKDCEQNSGRVDDRFKEP